MKNNCVFCAIAAGEIPSFKVYEDDIVLAYLDINPFTKGHVLVIPKEHTESRRSPRISRKRFPATASTFSRTTARRPARP